MSKANRLRVLVSILFASGAFYLWYCTPLAEGSGNSVAVAVLAAAASGSALSAMLARSTRSARSTTWPAAGRPGDGAQHEVQSVSGTDQLVSSDSRVGQR
jgi:hypothetical protein